MHWNPLHQTSISSIFPYQIEHFLCIETLYTKHPISSRFLYRIEHFFAVLEVLGGGLQKLQWQRNNVWGFNLFEFLIVCSPTYLPYWIFCVFAGPNWLSSLGRNHQEVCNTDSLFWGKNCLKNPPKQTQKKRSRFYFYFLTQIHISLRNFRKYL